MTSVIEKIVAIIAPHHCIVCGAQNNILCNACQMAEHTNISPVCCLCGSPTSDWQVCDRCSPRASLTHIWAAGEYGGVISRLVRLLKFERTKAAHEPLAALIGAVLPYDHWLVVPVPTAPPRVRQRGYDQAALLAKQIARQRGLAYSPALLRVQNVRQVGTNRVQRQMQSTKMFATVPRARVAGAKILLVDDVCTTGATLNAAAAVLRSAGAAQVGAVVAAWQPPKA